MKIYRDIVKRGIDITVSGIGLIITSPIILTVTILLHYANKGGGAYFFHERPGWKGRVFKVIKFKTMTDERDKNGELLPDTKRLTKIGRFIRSSSIDELPQLWNVFVGDMSLIGPRPLYTWFLPLYNKRQARRHDVRPGITGWAQVHGRNNSTYSRKFENDVWYVEHLSFKTDMLIIWLTIKNVIGAKDIGNGLDNEPDDLGWWKKEKEARELFEREYRK